MSSPPTAGNRTVTRRCQAGDGRRPAHRRRLEHHLGPQTRIDLKVPAAGPLRSTAPRARWTWSPTTAGGAPRRSPDRVTVWPRGLDVQDRINNGSFHVDRRRHRLVGHPDHPGRHLPQSRQLPSGGIEQLIFALQAAGGAAGPARSPSAPARPDRRQRRRADRQCAAEPGRRRRVQPDRGGWPKPASSAVANPDAAAPPWGAPLTVRIGYQSPNPRLAATVGGDRQILRRRGHHRGRRRLGHHRPQTLRDGQHRRAAGQHRGATGNGSTGSSAWTPALRTGNGNNLPGYSKAQIDGSSRPGGDRRPQGAGASDRRRVADAVGGYADPAAVPSAAHGDGVERRWRVDANLTRWGRAGTWTAGNSGVERSVAGVTRRPELIARGGGLPRTGYPVLAT